ncbi:endoribonuclease L-PSP [Penicillium argentinense]|uniref:Endoribonuclease L-PSP n=1 Tax=Penicillium argentinense TaxID=1131581 RepID=A0A9W9FHN0_9EURO|nr:endoribonuclease L-PSP [Penicillium argentinense]KAJ5100147.1 endoribonuclease L-PSP [Penicillium argentinense]
MSEATIIVSKEAPLPMAPYSQAVKTPTAIYLCGQIPVTADGNFVQGSIAEKTKQCLANLQAVLIEAGSSIQKVVKVTVFLTDMAYFDEMNGEYEKWFKNKPARSCVAVKALPMGADVEIEAIALP